MKILTNKKYGVLVDNIRKDFEDKLKEKDNANYQLLQNEQKWRDGYEKFRKENENYKRKLSDSELENNLLKFKFRDKISVQRVQTRRINFQKKEIEELKKRNDELNNLLKASNMALEKEKALRKGEYTKTILKSDRVHNTQYLGVRCSRGNYVK